MNLIRVCNMFILRISYIFSINHTASLYKCQFKVVLMRLPYLSFIMFKIKLAVKPNVISENAV